jgi:hypothetical protein
MFWFGDDFTVIETTSQKYYGGLEKSGHGTRYRIKLLAQKDSKKLKIDQLWIDDKYFEVKPVKDPKYRNNHEFFKKDTIFISVKDHVYPDELMREKQEEKIVLPYKYKGAALIGYKVRNKRKYKVIEKITELKKIFYP